MLLVAGLLLLIRQGESGPDCGPCPSNSYFKNTNIYCTGGIQNRFCAPGGFFSSPKSCSSVAIGEQCCNSEFTCQDGNQACSYCVQCKYGNLRSCTAGFFISRDWRWCGSRDTSDTSRDIVCSPCSNRNGGSTYQCATGYRKTHPTGCDGSTHSDVNTCTKCSHDLYYNGEKNVYTCNAGYYKTGTVCTGATHEDTQTCALCNPSFGCQPGQYIAGECTGTGFSDTQVCAECEGGADFICADLEHREYLLSGGCTGTTHTPAQLCKSCLPKPCPEGTVLINATKNTQTNKWELAPPCNGTGEVDTMYCVNCTAIENNLPCPEGTYRADADAICNNVHTQLCIPCQWNNEETGEYECPIGWVPLGPRCTGLSTSDTQECVMAPTTASPTAAPSIAFAEEDYDLSDITCPRLVTLIRNFEFITGPMLDAQETYFVSTREGFEERPYTLRKVLQELRRQNCIYDYVSDEVADYLRSVFP